jgi:hypothetical protein
MTVTLIPHKPDRIIGLKIDGKIETADLDRVVQSIENQLKPGQKLRIYVEVENWSGMSVEAFIQDLKFSLQHLQGFDREAIVSDHLWLKTLATVGNTLFFGVEVRHFTFDERDKAIEWIAT